MNIKDFIDNEKFIISCGSEVLATKQRFIGIELDNNYFEIAKRRIERTYKED